MSQRMEAREPGDGARRHGADMSRCGGGGRGYDQAWCKHSRFVKRLLGVTTHRAEWAPLPEECDSCICMGYVLQCICHKRCLQKLHCDTYSVTV